MRKYLPIILIGLLWMPAYGQGKQSLLNNNANIELQPVIGLQLWTTYTVGTEIYNADKGLYEPVDNRLNFQLRRSRFGIKGKAYRRISFAAVAALDLVGRDPLAGTDGGTNNGPSPTFRIWKAWLRLKILPNSEALYATLGYQLPQIGRESMTSALRSTSMEKSWSQNYIRRHLTGTGPGRAVGLNLGGLLYVSDNLSWGYDFGIFNPSSIHQSSLESKKYAALFVGRVALHLGDPESDKYTTSHAINAFNARKGLTIALAGATQGQTDVFSSNQALGVDVLFNWSVVNVDGGWTLLSRKGIIDGSRARTEKQIQSNTGYARISTNIPLTNHAILEPVVMLMQFKGPQDQNAQSDASTLNTWSGFEQAVDLGFNVYPHANLKLSIHYTHRHGTSGEAGPGSAVNNYFVQPGVGPIHRGDWLGMGVVTIF